MGQAFIVDTQQLGPRGGDKLYSVNWRMLGAGHKLGRGSFMLRSMLNLEPATVTDRRYPLLFQTGETAYGTPLADAQHPHDFVMELSVAMNSCHPHQFLSEQELDSASLCGPAARSRSK